MARFEDPLTGGVHPSLAEIASYGWPDPAGLMVVHGEAPRIRGVSLERTDEDGESDLDIIAAPKNWQYISAYMGAKAVETSYDYDEDIAAELTFIRSPNGRLDVFPHDFIPENFRRTGRGRVYPKQLFALHDARFDQDETTGIWVASIPFVIATKRATGRTKDKRDIRRLLQFQEQSY